MPLQIALLAETLRGERRVALTPEVVGKLVGQGHTVRVQAGAGDAAGWGDSEYTEAGAAIAASAQACAAGAEIVVRIGGPSVLDDGSREVDLLGSGTVLVSMLNPLGNEAGVRALAEHGVTAYAMELIPRISRAQSMDVLSSTATVAGYRAVLIAGERLDKFFPMLMTAAGTVAPAKVFVIGAGVAGLQAIATARRLGAVVTAYDTRAAVREQVESLGARFLDFRVTDDAEAAGGYARELTADELARQQELMADHIAGCDVVITTALVPGRVAPVIIPSSTVERMRSGAVVIDMASEAGGNCEPSRHGETVDHGGVLVIGPDNLPSGMPVHASQLYARNVANLLDLLIVDGEYAPDLDDEIVAGTCACRGGEVVHPMLRDRYGLAPAASTEAGSQ